MIVFRPATLSDADLLIDWRNDPLTRAASRNTAEVDLDWARASLAQPCREIFIVEHLVKGERDPVGTMRTDRVPEGIELSWTVAPEWRGLGVGTEMVRQFAEGFHCRLVAHVKETNLVSQKIAQAAGLQYVGTTDGLMKFVRGARPPIGAQQATDRHKQWATA